MLKTYRRLIEFGAHKHLSELKMSRTKLAEKNITHRLKRVNWDGKPPGYAENPDNWIFL